MELTRIKMNLCRSAATPTGRSWRGRVGSHPIPVKPTVPLWAWGETTVTVSWATATMAIGLEENTRLCRSGSDTDWADWGVVAAGWDHTVALKKPTATLWTWGKKRTTGQLGERHCRLWLGKKHACADRQRHRLDGGDCRGGSHHRR